MAALLIFFLHAPARAEYRAFELVIRANGQEQVQVSTLNPFEYRIYYPLPPSARIGYRATWMCRGNTSWHQPVCPNPRS